MFNLKRISQSNDDDYQYHLKRVKENPYFYKEVPEELRTEEMKDISYSYWLNRIKESPIYYKSFLEDFKQAEEIKQVLSESWLNHVKKDPSNYQNVPKEFQTEEMKKISYLYFLNLFKEGNIEYNKVPFDFKEGEIEQIFYLNLIKDNPKNYKYVPKDIKKTKEIQEALYESWLNKLKKDFFSYVDIPEEFKTEEIKKIAYNWFLDYVKKYPFDYKHIPKEFKTEKMKKVLYEGWLNFIKHAPYRYDDIPEEFKTKDMKEIAYPYYLDKIKKDPFNYKIVPKELKTEEIKEIAYQYYLDKIKKVPFNYKEVPEEFKTEEMKDIVFPNISKLDNYQEKQSFNVMETAKASNYKITCYHGTSSNIFNKIQDTGAMFSPRLLNTEQYEQRNYALDQVFITTDYDYAKSYSKRSSKQTYSNEVMLTFNIPVEKIIEFKILSNSATTEQYQQRLMSKPSFFQDSESKENKQYEYYNEGDWEKLMNYRPEKFSDAILSLYALGQTELTLESSLQLKWLVKAENLTTGEDITPAIRKAFSIFLRKVGKSFNLRKFSQNHIHFNLKKISQSNNDYDYFHYLNEIKKNPYNYRDVPEEFKTEEMEEIAYSYYLNKIKKNLISYTSIPEEFKTEEIKEIAYQYWLNLIKIDTPPYYEIIPEEFKTEEIKEIAYPYFLNKIKEDPYFYKRIPKELKTEEIKEIAYQYWLNEIKKNPLNYKSVPEEFKTKEMEKMEDIMFQNISKLDNYQEKQNLNIMETAKASNYKITCYHGTSSDIFNKIQDTGAMFSPRLMNTEQYEQREETLDQVFITANYNYAKNYSERSSKQTKSDEVMLTFNIPAEKIIEFKILSGSFTPKQYQQRLISKPSLSNKQNKQNKQYEYFNEGDWKKLVNYKPEKFSDAILSLYELGHQAELSLESSLQLKWLVKAENLTTGEDITPAIRKAFSIFLRKVGKSFNLRKFSQNHIQFNLKKISQSNDDDYQYHLNRAEENPYYYKDVPEKFKTKEMKEAVYQSWLDEIKENPFNYNYLPEEFKTKEMKKILYLSWLDEIKENPFNYNCLSEEFKTEEMEEALYSSWLNFIKENPSNYIDVPEDFKTEEMQERIREILFSNISKLDNYQEKQNLNVMETAKASNYRIICYHGTSSDIFNKIQDTGVMFSPRLMNTERYERRKKALDQVFLTTNYNSAKEYSLRSSAQNESDEVILTFNIPVEKIIEFKILSGSATSEQYQQKLMSKPSLFNEEDKKNEQYKYHNEGNWEEIISSKPDKFSDAIVSLYELGQTELTLESSLQLKWLVKAESYGEDITPAIRKAFSIFLRKVGKSFNLRKFSQNHIHFNLKESSKKK